MTQINTSYKNKSKRTSIMISKIVFSLMIIVHADYGMDVSDQQQNGTHRSAEETDMLIDNHDENLRKRRREDENDQSNDHAKRQKVSVKPQSKSIVDRFCYGDSRDIISIIWNAEPAIVFEIFSFCSGSLNNASLVSKMFSAISDLSMVEFRCSFYKERKCHLGHWLEDDKVLLDLLRKDASFDSCIERFSNLKILDVADMKVPEPERKSDYVTLGYDYDKLISFLKNFNKKHKLQYGLQDLLDKIYITGKFAYKLTNLTELNIKLNNTFSENFLSSLTNLRKLNIKRSLIATDKGISSLTNLEVLLMDFGDKPYYKKSNYGKMTDLGISRLTNLTHLRLAHHCDITDDAIIPLTKLKNLNLKYNTAGLITDESVSTLVGLEVLGLEENPTISNGILTQFTNLRSLNLYREEPELTREEGLEIVSKLTNLQWLNIFCDSPYESDIMQQSDIIQLRTINPNLVVDNEQYISSDDEG